MMADANSAGTSSSSAFRTAASREFPAICHRYIDTLVAHAGLGPRQ